MRECLNIRAFFIPPPDTFLLFFPTLVPYLRGSSKNKISKQDAPLLLLLAISDHTKLAQTPSPNTPKFDQLVALFAGIGLENQVAKYMQRQTTPKRVVFAGSSTFTNWGERANQRFASYGVVNQGIGGSDIRYDNNIIKYTVDY